MTSKKQNSISFWYSLQIQGGDPNPNPPPPPRRRKSFQIKVTVSIFKLVKVPAILNTKFRFDGSMVGGGGGGEWERRGEAGARNPKRATPLLGLGQGDLRTSLFLDTF